MKFKLLEKKPFNLWYVKACLIAFVLSMSVNAAQAQSINVKGKVTGDGQPLAGASIIVAGTSKGTVSDFDGNFEITTDSNSTLRISYLGYVDSDVKVNGQTTINVDLQEDAAALDEVVVVGYGTQKRKEITGAVGQVKNEDLVLNATSDIGTALQGQIAGVNVTAQSGQPGAEANILIRGIGSILGQNTPLYVVDGIPFDGDPKLSVDEIETIDVLKDGASSAIYGTRGANGVILITTKKGKEGVMKMNFHTWYGVQSITSGVPLMQTEDYLYSSHLNKFALNGTVFGNSWTPIVQGIHNLTNNSDLSKVVEVDAAPIQNHNISISGGREGLAYNINASMFKQEGMIINSGYERFNIRANTQYEKGKWQISTGLGFRIEKRDREPWNLLLTAYQYNPYAQLLDPSITEINHPGPRDNNDATNISNNLIRLKQTDRDNVDSFDANINAKYSITDNLSYTIRGGMNYTNGTRVQLNPVFRAFDENGELIPPSTRSGVREQYLRRTKHTLENILNYKKSFDDHNFQLTGVFSAEKSFARQTFADKRDLISNEVTELETLLGGSDVGNSGGTWNNRTITLLGMMARLQYNFQGKYLLSASVRRDGSSQFGEANRWGVFPSFSAGWNVSDEAFWQPLKSVASSLKIRAGLGTVGSDGFEPYSTQATITIDRDAIFGSEESDNINLGAVQTAISNKDLQWETSVSKNIGFDLGLFKNKLNVSADFYKNDKEDLLLPLLLPTTTVGVEGSTVLINVGDMTNKGVELALNYSHKGDKFGWNAGATFTKNNNLVTRMSGSNSRIALERSEVVVNQNNEDEVSFIAEGYPAGSFFLIQTDGIVNEDDLAEYQELFPTANVGDLKYVDAPTVDTNNDGIPDAGDGTINQDDRVFSGSGMPDFEMGFNFGAKYKNFDFSMQWYGAFGAEIMNGSKAFAYKAGTHRDLVYQWSPQNTTSLIPTNRGGSHFNYRGQTDFWKEDGSFVRLRNVALGYSIPKDAINKHGISNIRFYISAQNPLTITDYTGFDPEVGGDGLNTRGLDRGNYPVSATYRFGVQIGF